MENKYHLFCKEILAPIWYILNNTHEYDSKEPLTQIVIELHDKVVLNLLNDNTDAFNTLDFSHKLKEEIVRINTRVVNNPKTQKRTIFNILTQIFEIVKVELNYHNRLVRTNELEADLILKEHVIELYRNSVFFENLHEWY